VERESSYYYAQYVPDPGFRQDDGFGHFYEIVKKAGYIILFSFPLE